MMAKRMKDSIDDMQEAFRVFDSEGKGYIPVEELKSVMRSLDERLTTMEIDELMKEVDIHGLLTFEGTVCFKSHPS